MDFNWPTLKLDDVNLESEVEKHVGGFRLSDETLLKVQQIFLNEMELGLSKDKETRQQSSLVMENTYLRDTIHGKDEGDFLALDLGGSRFRILLVSLHNKKCETIFQCDDLPDHVLVGDGRDLFDYIASSIYKFIEKHNLKSKRLPLGFTFSFPMVQKSLRCGLLVTWTKSFKCTGCVNEDAVKHLEDAIRRHGGMDVEIVAILNDTTGTLMAGAYLDEKCKVGVILGTGFNSCYVERLENVKYWDGDMDNPKQVLIDTEMGAFGDNGVLDFFKTSYDFEVDRHSNHVHSFTFEKLFAGHYLGEILRLVMVKLIQHSLLFGGNMSSIIQERWKLPTSAITDVELDMQSGSHERTKAILRDMELLQYATDSDFKILRYVCALLSVRGGYLVGSTMAVFLNRIKESEVTIAVDGSLYQHHPRLHDLMMKKVAQFAPNYKCKMILAEDGSGKGAGLVAAVAARLDREKTVKTRL